MGPYCCTGICAFAYVRCQYSLHVQFEFVGDKVPLVLQSSQSAQSAMYERVTLAGRFINSMASPAPHVKSSCEAVYSDGLHVYPIWTGLVLIMMISFCYLKR